MGSSGNSSGSTTSPPADCPACPTDHPAYPTEIRDELRITTISLSGKKNFVPWVHSVRRVLQAKGLLPHLTQTPPTPPTDDWLRNDGRVQTWILNSLDGEPYQMTMYHETAKDMWTELHSLYSGRDSLQHLYDILTDLFALDAGGASDMTSFIARAKTLAEAWIQHQPFTNDALAQRAQKEAACTAIIMARLPPHLQSIRAQKVGYPPRPTTSVATDACPPDLESVRLQLQHLHGLLHPPSASIASVSNTGTACLSTDLGWIVDSDATHHITPHQPAQYLNSPYPQSITVANGATVPVSGSADLPLTSSISLRSALHVPSSPFNLLSVGRLTTDLDCSVIFTSSSFVIQDRRTQTTIGKGRLRNGLYLLDDSPTILSSIPSTAWNCRLGHAPLPVLRRALPDVSFTPFQCDSCILGKQTRSSFSSHCTRSAAPFDLVHSDIWGPFKIPSISGFRYFITFIDDHSRTTWLYLLRDRSELPRVFRAFVLETRTQFHTTIKVLRTDNAREYTSHEFTALCSEFGILHQTSCAYTPQQNGVAERKNRHLLDVARSLMLQMHVPKPYWNFAVSTACFLINRLPSSILNYATPFSILFPSATAFPLPPRVFGSLCYVHRLGPSSDKLDPRAAKHIFVGYSRTQKGYVCYSPATRKISVSADVIFREDQPFFSAPLPDHLPPTPPSIPRPVIPATTPTVIPSTPLVVPSKPPVIRVYTRRSTTSVAPLPSVSPMDTPRPNDQVSPSTAHPLANYISLHRLSPHLHTLATSLSSVAIPNSVQEALQHPGWRAAMEEEMSALWSNQTWSVVPLPPSQKPVGCKWVFVIKHAVDETIDRLKARLVARGFTQHEGLDYEETFSPVAKLNSVRVLISVAVHRRWPLFQLDINNAFLNGDLQETVYMQQPPGFETTGESQVCHLKKAIYVYVDDIIITGDDSQGIQTVKVHLNSVFQTKDLRPLRYFLGLEIARRPDGLTLSQRKYCLDLLHDASQYGCKPSDTPMDVNHKLCAQASDSDLLLQNPEYYRLLVEKLIYLTVTRPDISFAVGLVSRYMHSPRKSHLQAVERILSRSHQELIVYRPTWLSFSFKGEDCNSALPQKAKRFESFFIQLYTVSLAMGNEFICKDFFLYLETSEFGLFATSTAQNHDVPSTEGTVNGVPCVEKITFHLVRLEDGVVLDVKVFFNDFINLSHSMGVFLHEDLLCIMSMRYQAIHIMQIRDSGNFVDVRMLGKFCREDDELFLSSHTQVSASSIW
ncbi:hypothetical protein KSP40_PGU018853 [Platanthera guangdongensis]|uniref:Integrase catalytic domain-containing protein n=1 Tax=Platanthera guangdongensis TaxID=2320717 RepID=A0ABR2MGY2_9ASPA